MEQEIYKNEFIQYMRFSKRLSERTVEDYIYDLKSFNQYLNENNYKIDKKTVEEYSKYLDKKFKLKTSQRKIFSLKLYLKFLNDYNYSDRDYSIYLSSNKLTKKKDFKRIYHSQKEMQDLISRLSYKTHLESRNSTILLFLYFTGVRASELLNLKLDEINFESKYLLINGKGNKQRYVPMSESLIRVLKNYIKNDYNYFSDKKDNNYLFQNIKGSTISRMTLSRLIKELCVKYKFGHELMPHDLRFLCATHFLENGVDLYQISRFLGHENLSTTQAYLHLTKANLKKIYDKYIDIK